MSDSSWFSIFNFTSWLYHNLVDIFHLSAYWYFLFVNLLYFGLLICQLQSYAYITSLGWRCLTLLCPHYCSMRFGSGGPNESPRRFPRPRHRNVNYIRGERGYGRWDLMLADWKGLGRRRGGTSQRRTQKGKRLHLFCFVFCFPNEGVRGIFPFVFL